MMDKAGYGKTKPVLVRILAAAVGLLVLFSASGCTKNTDGGGEVSAKAGQYEIYYTDAEGDRLLHETYKPASENFEGILKEVLTRFSLSPKEGLLSTVPEGVKINSSTIGISEIDVDFSSGYLSLSKVQELLLRSALVETLVQLPGVDKVRFTVEGQPLTIDDQEIGVMNKDSFIVPDQDAINSYRTMEIPLYFSDLSGDHLVREYRKIYYSSNLNTERVCAEQIVKGPNEDSLLPVTGTSVIILGARVRGDTCLIDFSKTVGDLPAADSPVKPEAALYAFVNAICESCRDDGVTGVRFTIEGSSDERFRGQVNLDQTFYPDNDIVVEEKAGAGGAGVLVDGNGANAGEQEATEGGTDLP